MQNSTTKRPMSTPMTTDYTTQGGTNQVSPSTQICPCQLQQKSKFWALTIFLFQMGVTGVYIRSIIKLFTQVTWKMATTALEKMLNTWKFLMDEMSGQF